MASSEIHRVILPRSTRARSYSAQLLTRYSVMYLGWTLDFIHRSWLTLPAGREDVGNGSPQAGDLCTNATALLVLVTCRRERAVEMPGPQSFAR